MGSYRARGEANARYAAVDQLSRASSSELCVVLLRCGQVLMNDKACMLLIGRWACNNISSAVQSSRPSPPSCLIIIIHRMNRIAIRCCRVRRQQASSPSSLMRHLSCRDAPFTNASARPTNKALHQQIQQFSPDPENLWLRPDSTQIFLCTFDYVRPPLTPRKSYGCLAIDQPQCNSHREKKYSVRSTTAMPPSPYAAAIPAPRPPVRD